MYLRLSYKIKTNLKIILRYEGFVKYGGISYDNYWSLGRWRVFTSICCFLTTTTPPPTPITNTLLKVVHKITIPIYSLPYLSFLSFFPFFFWSLSYFYKFNLVKNDWNLSSTFSILLNAYTKSICR